MITAIDIANALATELEGASLSLGFNVGMSVLPQKDIKELAAIRITVAPAAMESEGATRAKCQDDLRVDVAVQRRVADPETDVPTLMAFTAEVIEFLRHRALTAQPTAMWVRLANEPIYATDHLREKRTFTSVIRTTYRVMQ